MTTDAVNASTILADWAAEAWAMEPTRLTSLFGRLHQLVPQIAAIERIEIVRPAPKFAVADGTAVIPIRGVLLNHVPKWFSFFGIEATSYGEIGAMVAQASQSEFVQRIRLAISSPGGVVPGVEETGDLIRSVRGRKPIEAAISEIGTSAAYWLAAQTDRISVQPNSWTGSIGVYTVYYDYSKEFEKAGIEAHVIASGPYKATGVVGSKITPEQVAKIKEGITAIAERFIAAVSAGRRLSLDDARAVATGQLWQPQAALELKLIDAIGSTPAAGTSSNSSQAQAQGDQPMSTVNEPNAAAAPKDLTADQKAEATAAGAQAEKARLAEFKAAFPDDLEYAVGAYENGVTVAQAQASYAILQKRVKAAAPDKTKAPDAATGADGRIGAQAAEGNAQAAAGPDFLAASRQYAAEHKCSMVEAMTAVRRTNRALHEQFLEQARTKARPVEGKVERVTT